MFLIHTRGYLVWCLLYQDTSCGNLGFLNPNLVSTWDIPKSIMDENAKDNFTQTFFVEPEKNVLYVFPKGYNILWMQICHRKRISLSFNTNLEGT